MFIPRSYEWRYRVPSYFLSSKIFLMFLMLTWTRPDWLRNHFWNKDVFTIRKMIWSGIFLEISQDIYCCQKVHGEYWRHEACVINKLLSNVIIGELIVKASHHKNSEKKNWNKAFMYRNISNKKICKQN